MRHSSLNAYNKSIRGFTGIYDVENFSHFNKRGEARMVDVGDKAVTHRVAVCAGSISMKATTLNAIREGRHKKGDVLGVARIAGIMAAKKTAELVPLCHPLGLSHVEITFELDTDASAVDCQSRVETRERTGVEMEALLAVQTALLTIYDMCKSADRGMVIGNVRLLKKSGGKSGDWERGG